MRTSRNNTAHVKKEISPTQPNENLWGLTRKTCNSTLDNLGEILSGFQRGKCKILFEYTNDGLALEINISKEILAAIFSVVLMIIPWLLRR